MITCPWCRESWHPRPKRPGYGAERRTTLASRLCPGCYADYAYPAESRLHTIKHRLTPAGLRALARITRERRKPR